MTDLFFWFLLSKTSPPEKNQSLNQGLPYLLRLYLSSLLRASPRWPDFMTLASIVQKQSEHWCSIVLQQDLLPLSLWPMGPEWASQHEKATNGIFTRNQISATSVPVVPPTPRKPGKHTHESSKRPAADARPAAVLHVGATCELVWVLRRVTFRGRSNALLLEADRQPPPVVLSYFFWTNNCLKCSGVVWPDSLGKPSANPCRPLHSLQPLCRIVSDNCRLKAAFVTWTFLTHPSRWPLG